MLTYADECSTYADVCSTYAQVIRQQYLLELPPGFEPDEVYKAGAISVSEETIDKDYRKLFGPPDAKPAS